MTRGEATAEERLSETLAAIATNVQPAPDAYRQVRAEWNRRERRRRLILAILIAIVFTFADAIGLWALNRAGDGANIIFNNPGVEQREPAGQVGPP